MTRREQAWARTVFDTLFPGRVGPHLARFMTETVDALPLSGGIGLRAALAAVTFAPIVLERRPTLLPQLDRAARLRVVERFARSDFYLARSAFTLLNATAALACAPTSGRPR
jgi:hypothetical protein